MTASLPLLFGHVGMKKRQIAVIRQLIQHQSETINIHARIIRILPAAVQHLRRDISFGTNRCLRMQRSVQLLGNTKITELIITKCIA